MTTAHWKLQDTLRRHGKTTMALARTSGLTKTTVYNIVNGKSKAVELETLGKLVAGLEKLIGQPMSFNDVLEREPTQPNALLETLLKDAKPFDWDEIKKQIPSWTPEEQAENDAFLEALETQRETDRALSLEHDQELLKLFSDPKPAKRGKRQ
jgi:DNA-binding Xre family transcriptional regulator